MIDGFATSDPMSLDRERRAFVAGLASLLVGGCTCADLKALPAPRPGELTIGDAHAHLFNAADLPVAGFLRHVLLPAHLAGWETLWPAIIGTASVLKGMTVSATAESRRLSFLGGEAERISSVTFADAVADHLERRVRAIDPGALTTTGGDAEDRSYAALTLLVESVAARERGDAALSRGEPRITMEDVRAIGSVDRAFIERVAREGAAAMATPVNVQAFDSLSLSSAADAGLKLRGLLDGVKWIFALIQPRCSHVHDYIATMTSARSRTVQLVNLLVDYDAWLDDAPAAGSEVEAQLRFWTRYARSADRRVAIELFAPYDPLRHAESRLTTGDETGYFASIQNWVAGATSDIEIRGFKLYPPMGFRAAGNGAAPPQARAGVAIHKRWAARGWKMAEFGAEIERSLDLFFDLCSSRRIPVLAHASNSQESYAGAGRLADPRHWLERAAKQGERSIAVCLAHFGDHDFGDEVSAQVLRRNAASPSKIFFDLSYADEILRGDAPRLISRVTRLCEAHDPECRWFLFGTDWIMIGRESGAETYVPGLLAAMDGIAFWTPARRANLLRNNLQSFLGGAVQE